MKEIKEIKVVKEIKEPLETIELKTHPLITSDTTNIKQ